MKKMHIVYRLKTETKLSISAHNLFAYLENPIESMNRLSEIKQNSVKLLDTHDFIQNPIVFLYTHNYKMKEKILLIVATKTIKPIETTQTRYVQDIV